MKKLGKIFANLLIVVYAVIAIAVTVLLLSYNEYHCSVIGGYTFVLVTDDELEDYGYPEGSLVLVEETKAKNINPGDSIFLYRQISTSQFEIKHAEVLLKDTSRGEYDVQYVLEGSTVVNHEDVIGAAENAKVIPHLGTILSILESRYGYLFLIVVVSFIAFLYEIYELIMEIKYGEREQEEEEDYDEEDDEYYDDEEYYEDEEEEIVRPKKATTTRKAATTTRKTSASPARKTATRTTPKTAAKQATRKTSSTQEKKVSTTTRKTGAASKASAAKKTAQTTKTSGTTARKKTTSPKE